jgi:integrase
MTALRQKMIDAMRMRGFSVRTHKSYLSAVSELALYYKRSPEALGVEELQGFFAHLALERNLSGATCRLYLNAVRFLYLQVLEWPSFDVPMTIPKKAQRIPELLTGAEVGRIVACCANPKHRMLLCTCYGCGLRVGEVVRLQVRHIDGERHLLRVEQGKGAKDRLVIVPEALLDALRRYWRLYHPTLWLFPGHRPDVALSISSAQRVYQRAKARAGVDKVGGIHSLRHAYATHQLEAGFPVHALQRLLGHQNLRSTLRYVHWVPDYRAGGTRHHDLIGALEVEQ